jgi:hypothetical protein
LVENWKPRGPQFDLIKMVTHMPENVKEESERIDNSGDKEKE